MVIPLLLKWLIIPIIVGIAGSYIYEKVIKRRPYRLTSYETIHHLYAPSDNDGISLSVKYNGVIIDNPISDFSLTIRNTGEKDLRFEKAFNKDGFVISNPSLKIIDASVRSGVSEIAAKVIRSDNGECKLDWDILKKGEVITIDIIAIVNDPGYLVDPYSHRCHMEFRSDVISNVNQSTPKLTQEKRFGFAFLCFFVASLMINTLISDLRAIPVNMNLNYQNVKYEEAGVYYNIFSNQYFISTVNQRCAAKLSEKDVTEIEVLSTMPKSIKYRIVNLSLSGLIIIGLILLLVFEWRRFRRSQIASFAFLLNHTKY